MSDITQKKLDQLNKATNRDVSRETLDTLEVFSDTLLKWNQKINLVSKKVDSNELWERHIIDSAQLLKYIPKDKTTIVDFGSGAGFPGIILAILDNLHVTLIESDQRKCAFMQEIITKYKLKAVIINKRIEEVANIKCDVITSRALASLDKLLEYSQNFLEKENFMLFLKGQNVVEEIKQASIYWNFQYEFSPSDLNKDGGILKISNLKRL